MCRCLTFLLLILAVDSQKCPPGCYCTGRYATCSGYITFPESFETSAEIVSIHRSSLPVIPAHAFKDATNLTEIYIYENVIGKIENCAFKELRNLTSLAIYNSDIGVIATGAFSNITFTEAGNTRFSIYQVGIDTIEPYAFTAISNSKVFNIYQANITTIEPYAFNELSDMPFFSIYLSNISYMKSAALNGFSEVRYVSIYSSFVARLDCGTFDRFTSELGNSFSFYELEVNCDCNVAMLMMAAKRNPAISVDRTRCRGPASVAGSSLGSLDIPQICKVGAQTGNCPIPKPAVPGLCPSPSNRDNDRSNVKNGTNGSGDNTRVMIIDSSNESEKSSEISENMDDMNTTKNGSSNVRDTKNKNNTEEREKDLSLTTVSSSNTSETVSKENSNVNESDADDDAKDNVKDKIDEAINDGDNSGNMTNIDVHTGNDTFPNGNLPDDNSELAIDGSGTDNMTENIGNDLGVKDGEGSSILIRNSSSVVVAIFSGRFDLMSLVLAFFNLLFK